MCPEPLPARCWVEWAPERRFPLGAERRAACRRSARRRGSPDPGRHRWRPRMRRRWRPRRGRSPGGCTPEAGAGTWATGSLRGAAENCETPQMTTARTMSATSTRARGEMPQRVLRVVPGASASSQSSQSSHSSRAPDSSGASGLSSARDALPRRTVSSRSQSGIASARPEGLGPTGPPLSEAAGFAGSGARPGVRYRPFMSSRAVRGGTPVGVVTPGESATWYPYSAGTSSSANSLKARSAEESSRGGRF